MDTRPASTMIPRQEWFGMSAQRPSSPQEPGVLARILYRLRAESGMSQLEVALAAGWKSSLQTYYSNLERGAIKLPSARRVADLERAFKTEPGWIENQLDRREKRMMAPLPPEPEPDYPFPMGPLPRISAHAREIQALDQDNRFLNALEAAAIELKERAREERAARQREDRTDSEPDSLEPTA